MMKAMVHRVSAKLSGTLGFAEACFAHWGLVHLKANKSSQALPLALIILLDLLPL